MAYNVDNPADPQAFQVQKTPIQGQGIPQGVTANPGETPAQTAARYQQDYHAPDAASVNADISAWANPQGGQQQPQSGGSAFNGQSFYGKTDPASVNSYVQGMLQGTGREGDAQMWANYITKAGGGPNGYWDNLIKQNKGGDAGGGGGQGGGAYVPGKGVGAYGSIYNAGGGNPRSNALEDLLMKRAGQNIIPSPNDPVIKAQTDAFGAMQTRGARQGEAIAAERGGPNANQSAITRSADENAALNTSQFEGQAMQRELDARRQEVQAALSGAQGMLTAEEQMQLQEELAQLGLAQGDYQFGMNDAYRNSPMGPGYAG